MPRQQNVVHGAQSLIPPVDLYPTPPAPRSSVCLEVEEITVEAAWLCVGPGGAGRIRGCRTKDLCDIQLHSTLMTRK